jgi:chitinase
MGSCSASWAGVESMSQPFLGDIATLQSNGGNVIVSFGGENGVELAQSCTTVSALEAQYQSVIDLMNLTRIDFDIEGGAVADARSIDLRNKALAGLQAAAAARNKPLLVQYTLPVLPTGLTQDGVNLLRNAVQNGVDLAVVNVMAMDYGQVANPNQMGQEAIHALNATFAQLQSIYGSSKTGQQLWAMLGATPMIGMNDTPPEVFTTNDAQALYNAARTNQIGLVAMWSVGRDQSCPNNGAYVASNCSGIVQTPFQFTSIFGAFTSH